ncbi:hypothetical protein BHE74_00020106 [Ensete ventricosum]|nr:hypothetical protein BHE74_00020106 [Ensete ventricosum]
MITSTAAEGDNTRSQMENLGEKGKKEKHRKGREEGAHVGLEEGDVVLVKRARILLVDLVLGLGSHGTLLSSRSLSLSLSLSVRLVLRYKSAAAPPAARHSPKYKGTADKRKPLVKYRPSDGQRTVDSSSLGRSPPYIAR